MKKYLIPVAAFVAGMAMMPNTFALEVSDDIANWADLKTCLADANVECKVAESFSHDGNGDTTEGVHVTGDVVLDLGSNTIDFVNMPRLMWVDPGASLTIKGEDGKIVNDTPDSTGATIFVYGDTLDGTRATELNIEEGVTIEGFNPVMVSTLDNKASENVTVNIEGDLNNNVDATDVASQALGVHGNIQEGSKPQITVSGNLNGVNAGVFLAGQADTTLDGASVEGESGIVMKSGNLNLDEATVKATGEYAEGTSSSNGFEPTGAAVQIESNPETYAGDINIELNDSTLTSEKGDVFQVYGTPVTDDTPNAFKSLKITGDKVTLEAAEGKKVMALAPGMEAPETMTVDGLPKDLTAMGNTFTTVAQTPDPNPNPADPTDPDANKPSDPADKPASDAPAAEKPAEDKEGDEALENPNTSDKVGTYLTMVAVSVLGLVGTVVAAKVARRKSYKY